MSEYNGVSFAYGDLCKCDDDFLCEHRIEALGLRPTDSFSKGRLIGYLEGLRKANELYFETWSQLQEEIEKAKKENKA